MKYKNTFFWLLWTGLLAYLISFNLPLMSITKVFVFKDEISLLSILTTLWQESEFFLFVVISCFVVIIPICKFVLLILSGVNSNFISAYNNSYKVLAIIGKWAMLDVFVVAVIIVIIKLGVLTDAHAKVGLYVFVYSILASMACTLLQKHDENIR